MHKTLLAAALAVLSVSAFAQEGNMVQEMRETAMSMPPKLLDVLNAEIKKSGHAEAMSVCREKAPAMAKALSEAKGVQIRRVSLKNRNPKAVPDAWERAVLEDFDRRAAAGEKPVTLERGEVVAEGGRKTYRYMKALPTMQPCTNCHGDPATMKPAVIEKLASLYPQDRAVGYKVGDIRGAITLKKPL